MWFKYAAFAVLFSLAPVAGQATLIKTATSFGSDTGVLDQATGRTWLRFPLFSGKSFSTLPAVPGYELAGEGSITTLIKDALSGPGTTNDKFFALVTLFGASLRDDGGSGLAFTFGAVDASTGPPAQLQKFNSPSSPIITSKSHGVYAVSFDRTAGLAFYPSSFEGTVLPDLFKTGVTSQSGQTLYNYFQEQGYYKLFDSPGFPDSSLALTTSGFWLVNTPALTEVPEPASLAVLLTGFAWCVGRRVLVGRSQAFV